MPYPAGSTVNHEVDPISRIEGHLGIAVNAPAGTITEAYAHGNLWRGFENFLLGRDVNDAITFVQRICGVCPVPHGMTSTYAVDAVLGYSKSHITFAYDGSYGVPAKAVSVRNLVLGCEFLMSSITHFYHLAAPSYVQGPNMPPWTPYFANSFYDAALQSATMGAGGLGVLPGVDPITGFATDVWSAVIQSYVDALRIRRLTFEAGALFAGRMPMTSTYVGGGVTYDGTEDLSGKITTFTGIMQEVGAFVIQQYVPIALALGALPAYNNYDNAHNVPSSPAYGSGLGRFLAWGAFPSSTDTSSTAPLGIWGGMADVATPANDFQVKTKADVASMFLDGGTHSVKTNLTEDISNSRYQKFSGDNSAYTGTKAYPGDISRTQPQRSSGYTYMKAPRWNNLACEVGPMARMYVNQMFIDGEKHRSNARIGSAYAKYVKIAGATPVTGLDPAMIDPNIAVALLNAGLAEIMTDHGAPATHITSVVGLPKATIVAVYTDPTTVITGTIAGWVYDLTAGLSTMDRLRARALESFVLIQSILGAYTKPAVWGGAASWAGGWVADLTTQNANTSSNSTWKTSDHPPADGINIHGWGGTEAPRGALMHHATINTGKIVKYQCIVPTTWNGSPAVGAVAPNVKTNHGAIEAAVMGAPFSSNQSQFKSQAGAGTTTVNTATGVEVLRIAQSFDPCIACAVH